MKLKFVSIIVAIMIFLVGCGVEDSSEVEEPMVNNEEVAKQEEIVDPVEETAVEEPTEEEPVQQLAPDFTLLNLNDEEVSLIHSHNERISLDNILKATEFYLRLIEKL